MAMEPINSIMSIQAAQVQPKTTVTKPAVEYTDVSIADNTPKVDNTTRVIENVDEKDKEFNERNEQKEATNDSVTKAVEQLNKKMSDSEAIFGIHEGTNRVTIKIVDKETKKIIKELPAEKTLDMIAKVWEIAGLMVDEKR